MHANMLRTAQLCALKRWKNLAKVFKSKMQSLLIRKPLKSWKRELLLLRRLPSRQMKEFQWLKMKLKRLNEWCKQWEALVIPLTWRWTQMLTLQRFWCKSTCSRKKSRRSPTDMILKKLKLSAIPTRTKKLKLWITKWPNEMTILSTKSTV